MNYTKLCLVPVGYIAEKNENIGIIEIYNEFEEALQGLERYEHIIILSWLHKNDTPEKRSILKVHPRGDPRNPLAGVFATRSPARPNPIALNVVKLLGIDGTMLKVEGIGDLFIGTPVVDIKPYVPRLDRR
ncbi:MAG: tRNA (N6-threonylcarbamoyladenosine(37)-N6)-methyltransferase TrmO [Candidatus Njordarchaeum guaymaensis]